MSVNYTSLKNELNTDPASLGYAPLVALGNDAGLAMILNFTRNGTTPCPVNNVTGAAVSIKRANVSPSEILEAIDIRDFLASPAGVNNNTFAASWFESITQFSSIRLANDDGTKSQVRRNIDRMVADTQGSQGRLDAVATRFGTRAELLFGAGTVITDVDIAIALRQTP